MKQIQKNSIKPLYLQIREYLLHKSKGKSHYRFPSERELCKLFAVSRPTARKALDFFIKNNLIARHPGKGTFLINRNTKRLSQQTIKILIRNSWKTWRSDSYFGRIMNGIMSSISTSNFKLQIENYSDRKKYELSANDELLIWLSPENSEISAIKELAMNGLPSIVINRIIDYPGVVSICTDHELGANIAVSHLIERGHKSILYVGSNNEQIINEYRYDGYIEACKRSASFNFREPLMLSGEDLNDKLKKNLKNILEAEDPPSAIFLANGNFQETTLNTLEELNLKTPEDISLISFDNVHLYSQTKNISVIDQEVELLAEKAIENCKKLGTQKKILIAPKLIERGSVKSIQT